MPIADVEVEIDKATKASDAASTLPKNDDEKANAKGKKKKKKPKGPSVAPGLEGSKSASRLPGSRSSGRRDLE